MNYTFKIIKNRKRREKKGEKKEWNEWKKSQFFDLHYAAPLKKFP